VKTLKINGMYSSPARPGRQRRTDLALTSLSPDATGEKLVTQLITALQSGVPAQISALLAVAADLAVSMRGMPSALRNPEVEIALQRCCSLVGNLKADALELEQVLQKAHAGTRQLRPTPFSA
jgi:hypothetical protein